MGTIRLRLGGWAITLDSGSVTVAPRAPGVEGLIAALARDLSGYYPDRDAALAERLVAELGATILERQVPTAPTPPGVVY